MKNLEIVKDLIISVLIVGVIVLAVSIFLYDGISLSKIIPESQEYILPEQMKEDIEDTTLEEVEEVVSKYYIDSVDMKKYEKNNEYNPGKRNPFAINSESPENNNTSGNFYEDDGTK